MNKLLVIFEFEARALWNDKSGLIRMLIEPLAYLFLLTAGLGSTFTTSAEYPSYISFVYPGIVALQGFRAFIHSMYRLTIDRRWGLQALKIVAGTHRSAYLIGHTMIPVLLTISQIIITSPCALFLGVQGSITAFIYLLSVGLVVAFFWTTFATILCFYFKSYSQRDLVINFLFLPMTLSAPIFYSLNNAPAYLKFISNVNPLTYQVEALREAFLNLQLGWNFFILLGISLVLFGIAHIVLSKAEFLPSEVG